MYQAGLGETHQSWAWAAYQGGTPGAAEDYVAFLSSGGSAYPVDILKRAGVDMTTPAAVETTFGILGEYVDRLDQLTR